MARYEGPARGVETKSSGTDMVSEADREAETAIAEMLRSERPGDGLIGEEGADESSDSGRRWVVDPLDGTTNYLYRFPAWAVSVAVEDENGGLAGVVYDPVADELFSAARGEGARLNGRPIEVSGADRLDTSLIGTGFGYEPAVRAHQAEIVSRVLPRVRDIRRAGAAALDLCFVAAGRLDGYYERGIHRWDYAAGALIVREAGGEVVELEGGRFGLAAASPAIARELADLVREP
jgi:myo-inositol-1(or 4)-monophosphatase